MVKGPKMLKIYMMAVHLARTNYKTQSIAERLTAYVRLVKCPGMYEGILHRMKNKNPYLLTRKMRELQVNFRFQIPLTSNGNVCKKFNVHITV